TSQSLAKAQIQRPDRWYRTAFALGTGTATAPRSAGSSSAARTTRAADDGPAASADLALAGQTPSAIASPRTVRRPRIVGPLPPGWSDDPVGWCVGRWLVGGLRVGGESEVGVTGKADPEERGDGPAGHGGVPGHLVFADRVGDPPPLDRVGHFLELIEPPRL